MNTDLLKNIAHCWYSHTQDQQRGHVFYLVHGREAKVTIAYHGEYENHDKGYLSPDSIYLGLGTFLRETERSKKWYRDFERLLDIDCDTPLEEAIARVQTQRQLKGELA